MDRFAHAHHVTRRAARTTLAFSAALAALLVLATAVSAAGPRLSDNFRTLDPAVWHVTDTDHPTTPMDHCPARCIPANVTIAHGRLDLTVPPPTQDNYGGGQIVSRQQFSGGTFTSRFAAGSSHQTLNGMFLFNFTTQDEIDIEVTYDGHDHDGCGAGAPVETASHRWEVWFTVWQGTGTGSTCVAHTEFALADGTEAHTYAINWQAGGIAFSVDHKRLWTAPPLAATGMQLVFNTFQPGWKFVQPVPASVMRVDWVRVK